MTTAARAASSQIEFASRGHFTIRRITARMAARTRAMNRFAPALALIGLVALLVASRQTADGAELLVNGSFESGTSGWLWTGEIALEPVTSPVRSGLFAARASGDNLATPQEVQQRIAVQPGSDYQFSGWILSDDPNIASIVLQIMWFDIAGSPIESVQSIQALTDRNPSFRLLATPVKRAPSRAHTSEVQIKILRTGNFDIYLDDFSFDGPTPIPKPSVAPSPATTPNPTLAPTPAPTATSTTTPPTTIAPTPTSPSTPKPPTPAAPTKTPKPAPTPTPSSTSPPAPPSTSAPTPAAPPPSSPAPTSSAGATPQPTGTPVIEPSVFPQLTNGGFEQTRDDGSPYAWRKFGGAVEVVTTHRYQGSTGVRFSSNTTSTKWLHQTIAVNGNEYYEASGYALKNDPEVRDVFLRVSFYTSDDGLGPAIDTADSLKTLSNDDPNFRRLTTGPVQTPPDARTVRLRLMLRPSSNAPAEAYFDGVSFARVPKPIDMLTGPSPSPTATNHAASGTPSQTITLPTRDTDEAADRAGIGTDTTSAPLVALAADSTPISLANVGPSSAPAAISSADTGHGDIGWLIVLALALPAIGLASVGIWELHRTRPERK